MVAIALRMMMVKASSSKLEVAEEEVNVKGKVEVGDMVKGGGTVEGGVEVGRVVVKGEVKVEVTLVAVAVTMMGKAIQELMSSLPFHLSLGVLVALVT